MRDDNYLQLRLDVLWDRYFSYIEQRNDVRIQFGRKVRTRLGSIKQERFPAISNSKFPRLRNASDGEVISNQAPNSNDQKPKLRISNHSHQTYQAHKPNNSTIITINGLFKDKTIPEFLIDSVIAHEMVHYAHGFASPHEKKYATPHAGGIIKKEMQERGLEDLFILQKKWLKVNWKDFVEKKVPRKTRVRRRRKRRLIFVLR